VATSSSRPKPAVTLRLVYPDLPALVLTNGLALSLDKSNGPFSYSTLIILIRTVHSKSQQAPSTSSSRAQPVDHSHYSSEPESHHESNAAIV
jgi:hypothetical protein